MRRKGYAWNREKQVYELKGVKPTQGAEEVSSGTKKVRQVLRLFEEGKDPKEVAKEVGFKNHLALAEYMQEKGYRWNHKTQRYEQQVGELKEEEGAEKKEPVSSGHQEDEVMQLLLNNKDKLAKMLQTEESKKIPRYSLPGVCVSKTLQVSNRLNELIKEFTEQKNINHREFFEIAAIETLIKYGYEAEVKGILE